MEQELPEPRHAVPIVNLDRPVHLHDQAHEARFVPPRRKDRSPYTVRAPAFVSRFIADFVSQPFVGQLALFSALRAFFVSWRVFISSWVGLAPRPITRPVAAAPRFGSASSH